MVYLGGGPPHHRIHPAATARADWPWGSKTTDVANWDGTWSGKAKKSVLHTLQAETDGVKMLLRGFEKFTGLFF